MANSNVFSGEDVVISIALDPGVEGDKAKQVVDAYHLTPVGRATGIEVHVNSELKPFHEIGQQYPVSLKAGNVTISGSLGRAYINGALLKLLLGEAATARPASTWVQPSFNIAVKFAAAAFPDATSTLFIHGVKFQNWSLIIPENDFVMEKADFMALYITVDDQPK
jgi:hypothetical protein